MASLLMMVTNQEAGLVDVIEEAEEEDGANQEPPTVVTGLSSAAERAAVVNGLEVLTDNSHGLDGKNGVIRHHHLNESAPLSTWLMPELAKVAETLQLLRARLPSTAIQGWQLEDAICNALEATRRVADQYVNHQSPDLNTSQMNQNGVDGDELIEHDPNSEYQTLSRYALNGRSNKSDSQDYQKLAMLNGLAPPDNNYEASVVTTLSDEDEYDRLAYEFPIHPSMRNRSNSLPSHATSSEEEHNNRPQITLPPRPVLVDAAVGRSTGSVQTTDKGCNTYRVLNVSRPVQAVELPPAKFSKHVQTHVLVTDKCVGSSEDDDLGHKIDAEVQTDEVYIKPQRTTEDSWGQTEDKFTENASVYANMLRDFGQSISTQTMAPVPIDMPSRYVQSPTPLVAQALHYGIQQSPRSLTPTVPPMSIIVPPPPTRRQFSNSSSSAGSLRSPSSTSTPVAGPPANGCYQLFVRIDQSNNGSTANMLPAPVVNGKHSSAFAAPSHSRLLSTSSSDANGSIAESLSNGDAPSNSSFLASSTMSPPTSDSHTTATTNDPSLSDDRASSPRSWQSPIHITGPTDPSPVLGRPVLPPRMRRASMNPQAQPFRSGALADSNINKPTSYKSLIKISEGSPPEIRHTKAAPGNAKSTTQLQQVVQQNPRTVTKIIHRLQRDPSIRAWCSVDNLLRQSTLSLTHGMDGKVTPVALERAISPPALFRELGEISTNGIVNSTSIRATINEMAIDCAHVSVAHRRNKYIAEVKPSKSKQLSLGDVSHSVVMREPQQKPPPSSSSSSSKQRMNQLQLQQQLQRESVVCVGRRTLVSVGSEDVDYSVCETVYDKPRPTSHHHYRHASNNHQAGAKQRRSNYPAVANLAALHGSRTDFDKLGSSGANSGGSNSSGSAGGSNSNSVLSRLTNFLHFGNSKQKRLPPIQC